MEASQDVTVPSELAGPLPRNVFLNMEGDGRYLLIIVLIFFVGGLSFLAWLGYEDINQFHQRAALRGNVREVVGKVTGFTFPRGGPTSVNYTFTLDGVDYSSKALESRTPGPGTRFEKGDSILIRFLPLNPAINHPDAWEWSLAIGWASVLCAVFQFSIGLFALVGLLRDRKLARLGKAVAASVTACTPKDRFFHVEYEFQVEGVVVKGTHDGKDEYLAGARIWVLYLSNRPQRNDLYPLNLYSVL